MGDNYVDIPCLVLKVWAHGTITAGSQLMSDTSGYLVCTDSALAVGMMAMEATADSGEYFDAMVIGTGYFGAPESTTHPGVGVTYSAAGKVVVATQGRCNHGTLLDRVLTDTVSRGYRVFLWGAPCQIDTWVTA